MKKLVIAAFLNTEIPTTFRAGEWPLHVTLHYSFTPKVPVEALAARLEAVGRHHTPMWATGRSRAMFGPSHDVPVTKIELTPMLARLHGHLVETFADVATIINSYPAYQPHVTDNCGLALAVGETAMLRSLSLVERVDESSWLVRHTSQLA
jgi:hypothetical protein